MIARVAKRSVGRRGRITPAIGFGATRSLVAAVLLGVTASAGCSGGEVEPPALGRSPGKVLLVPAPEPAAGTTVVLRVTNAAGPEAVGGACIQLDRWDDGEWETRWTLREAPAPPTEVVDGMVTCEAIGVALPHDFTLAFPAELDAGTWRVGYGWAMPAEATSGGEARPELAAYVFEVGS